MPSRNIAIVEGEIYHVFNRSIAKNDIFHDINDYSRMINALNFYRFFTEKLSYSKYNKKTFEERNLIIKSFIENSKDIVEIYAFSVMPNHLHFLLKSLTNLGIQNFMMQIQHAYSKYYNLKYKRTGSLFQSKFKAKRVETDEEFLHISRYVHLNHVTSYLINIQDLEKYPWTSFKDYMHPTSENSLVNTKRILEYFGSSEKYKEFIFDQVDYQRELAYIKHLL